MECTLILVPPTCSQGTDVRNAFEMLTWPLLVASMSGVTPETVLAFTFVVGAIRIAFSIT